MATTEITVQLHKPHPKQAEVKQSKAKRKVIVAGRRVGKTTVVSDIASEGLLQGRRVLEAAPTAEQTDAFWDMCKLAFAEPIAAGLIYKNETLRLLECRLTGGRIRTKTAYNADTLRGDHADLLILDEYSLMDPSAWDEVGAPMLLDNNGDAIFIFTPKRRNHAYHMYNRAISDDTGRWQAWHFTSLENPYLSAEALAEITADMSADAYRQEILAEFLEGEGAVFRNINACMHAPTVEPGAHMGHRIVAGLDWAKQADYTAISAVCADCHVEIARDRFNQIDYTVQRGRLVAFVSRWGVTALYPESNSIGGPNIEALQRDPELRNVRIVPFETTATSKPPLIESLVLAFEREECQWQDDPIWAGELEAYEAKYSATTGRPSYSAPEGLHDDTVIARALAWQAATHGYTPAGSVVTVNPNAYKSRRGR